jgi:hypothetical protein
MFQNDILIKLELTVESLLKKIERQYLDIEDKQAHIHFEIDNRGEKSTKKNRFFFTIGKDVAWFIQRFFPLIGSVDKYIRDFKWDDSKYPRNNQLPDLVKVLANVKRELK